MLYVLTHVDGDIVCEWSNGENWCSCFFSAEGGPKPKLTEEWEKKGYRWREGAQVKVTTEEIILG